MNRFANYLVRRRLCLWVVYRQDVVGRKPSVAHFADGCPAIFASAKDAFGWVIHRIANGIGCSARLTELS